MRRRTVQFCAVVFGLLVVYTGLAHAAPGSTGSGSCGPAPEQYGLTGIAANMFGPGSRTVPALHYKVDYVVDNPTTLALLVRQNDEIGATEFILSSWPSSGTQGSYEGAWLADIRPEAQGAGFSVGPAVGRYDGPANSQWLMRSQSNYAGRGGHTPGGWAFYIYMGEWKLGEDNAYHFNPDIAGPIGKFICNVADDDAKN